MPNPMEDVANCILIALALIGGVLLAVIMGDTTGAIARSKYRNRK